MAINEDMVQLVRYAYGDNQDPTLGCRSLEFETEEISDWDTFCAAIRAIGVYESFDPEAVIAAVRDLFGEFLGIQIARSGGPMLYFHIPSWQNQQIKNQGKPVSYTSAARVDIGGIAARIIVAMNGVQAAETIGVGPDRGEENDNLRTIGAWWHH